MNSFNIISLSPPLDMPAVETFDEFEESGKIADGQYDIEKIDEEIWINLDNCFFDNEQELIHFLQNVLMNHQAPNYSFSFSQVSFYHDAWNALIKFMATTHIKSLRMKMCLFLEDQTYTFEGIRPYLKTLYIMKCAGNQQGKVALDSLLTHNDCLEKIAFKNSEFGNNFFENLQNCSNLTTLTFDNSCFTPDNVNTLCKLLPSFTTLEALHLKNISISNQEKLNLIVEHPYLQFIDLSENHLSFENILTLCQMNPRLNSVDLSFAVFDQEEFTRASHAFLHDENKDPISCFLMFSGFEDFFKNEENINTLNQLRKKIRITFQDRNMDVKPQANSFEQIYNLIINQFDKLEIVVRNKSELPIHLIKQTFENTDQFVKNFNSNHFGLEFVINEKQDKIFRAVLEKFNYFVGKADADGSCFFHSVSSLLNQEFGIGTFESSMLREQVVETLRENPQVYEGFVFLDDSETYSDYLRKMSLPTEYVSHTEIEILSQQIERQIRIFDFLDFKKAILTDQLMIVNNELIIPNLIVVGEKFVDSSPLHLHLFNVHYSPIIKINLLNANDTDVQHLNLDNVQNLDSDNVPQILEEIPLTGSKRLQSQELDLPPTKKNKYTNTELDE